MTLQDMHLGADIHDCISLSSRRLGPCICTKVFLYISFVFFDYGCSYICAAQKIAEAYNTLMIDFTNLLLLS